MPIPIPQYHEMMWPVLTALKELGGSATVQEMYEQVVRDEGYTEDQQQVLTKDKRMPEIQYRLHWARTHLRAIGAIENSARGVWTITEHGKNLSQEKMHEQVKAWRAADRARRQGGRDPSTQSRAESLFVFPALFAPHEDNMLGRREPVSLRLLLNFEITHRCLRRNLAQRTA